jgi:N-sulfoglucosamine sulfohydrolase
MRHTVAAIFILSLVLISGCSDQRKSIAAGEKPNIIWMVTEDISPALGCYGDDYAITPALDKFAEKAIRFEHAYATAPICAPSRSCLITGIYATSMGTQHLRTQVAKPTFIRTFPEYLKEAGYFVTNIGKTDYNFNPEGIWDYWKEDRIPWRQRKTDQPFFSFMNIGNTHEGPGNIDEAYEAAVADLPEQMFHDPEKANLPPYFPETYEMKRIWAHYYDLVSDLDNQVAAVMDSLEKDKLLDNTIIFFFSDHGFGLPRYKRWLYKTGLHVPLIVYIPEKYRYLTENDPGTVNSNLVSFVDFAPTVLELAGVNIPEHMQGIPFLGPDKGERKNIFGARSRADDMYEISRAVLNKDYIYIRHFLPNLAYIQPGFIFGDQKNSFRELRRLYKTDTLTGEPLKMWQKKPAEELYDLKNDPLETVNLAEDPEFEDIKLDLRSILFDWILKTRDIGFLMEPEYWIRSVGTTPYEMAQDENLYDLKAILEAADLVGKASIDKLISALEHPDSGVRFWAITGLSLDASYAKQAVSNLEKLLSDSSPVNQIAAAGALCNIDRCDQALPVLQKWVEDDRPWLALYAARTIQLIGDKSCPLIPVIYKVLEKNLGEPGARLRYKDFNFAAFTSWALEVALVNCGEDFEVNGGN